MRRKRIEVQIGDLLVFNQFPYYYIVVKINKHSINSIYHLRSLQNDTIYAIIQNELDEYYQKVG